MTKGISNLYPVAIEREAAINEAKVQVILKLLELERRVGSSIVLENDVNFKEFQSTLNLFEVNIGNGLPTILLSASAFESALNRAKNEKWIFLKRTIDFEGIHEVSKKFRLGLTEKGRKAALGEVERIAKMFHLTKGESLEEGDDVNYDTDIVYKWIANNTILTYNI